MVTLDSIANLAEIDPGDVDFTHDIATLPIARRRRRLPPLDPTNPGGPHLSSHYSTAITEHNYDWKITKADLDPVLIYNNNIESNITTLELEEKRISKNIKENTCILQEICTKKIIISEEIKQLEQVRENENKKLFEQKQKNKEVMEEIEKEMYIKINEKEENITKIEKLKNELSDYKNTIKYTKENDIQEIEKNKIYLINIKDEINIKEQEKQELIDNIKEIEEVYK
jgi:hypothetical protein